MQYTQDQDLERKRCTILRTIYAQDDYRVFEVRNGSVKEFKAVGYVIETADLTGAVVELVGKWEEHLKYGQNFRFVSLEVEVTKIGTFMERFVKGIGKKTAAFIDEKFKDEGIFILDHEPERLLEIPGITEKKLKTIVTKWQEQGALNSLSNLIGKWLGPRQLVKIFNHLGSTCSAQIKASPYVLTNVPGIGFRMADKIALQLGADPRDPLRIRKGIAYIVEQHAKQRGDTLVAQCKAELEAKKELDHEELGVSIGVPEIRAVIVQMLDDSSLVKLAGNLATRRYYNIESNILRAVEARVALPKEPIMGAADVEKFIAGAERRAGFTYAEEQKQIVRLIAAGHKIALLSGGAGTGKTEVSRVIVELLSAVYGKDAIACCALAGKAADKVRQATGFEARTIHSLLGWNGEVFNHRYTNRLEYKVVVLDESSMIPSGLLLSLIEALEDDAVFVMIGDDGQVSPAGEGSPYEDLLKSGRIPTVNLTRIHRQGPDSVLVDFAAQVRVAHVPADYAAGRHKDFRFIPCDIPNYMRIKIGLSQAEKEALADKSNWQIMKRLIEEVAVAMEEVDDVVTDLQILLPMRNNGMGTQTINRELQPIMNPYSGKDRVERNGAIYIPGDKVIHLINKNLQVMSFSDYQGSGWTDNLAEEQRVYNGSVGRIEGVDLDAEEIVVSYPAGDGYVVKYSFRELGDIIEHAFALTAHKCQGSEYARVIVIVTNSHRCMLNNRWLYTAITRGKAHTTVIGQSYTFEWACKQAEKAKRETVLQVLLKEKK